MIHIKDRNEQKAIALARRLGNEADEKEIAKVEDNLPAMNRGPVAKVWDKVQDLYRAFLSDDTPNSLRMLIIGGLLYLVLPFDIVPDVLPGVGLLDDVAVIAFIWKKMAGLAKVGVTVASKALPQKVEDHILQAYDKAFELARAKLEALLKKQERKTVLNCVINLGVFCVALLLLSIEGELPLLLASLCILVTMLRSLYSFFKTTPTILLLLKIWWKKRTIDGTIADYLRVQYPFIVPLEQMKTQVKMLDGIPSLETMVGMQRRALRKTIISVGISLLVATGLVFVLRHLLLALNTPYTFWELLLYPFFRLWILLMK
ncbi:MAG: DUF1232 domain-containing protein [Sphaerochaeta sp.]|nr:DUF1232 domain-containing protein [Sphaerochaeta sp.]